MAALVHKTQLHSVHKMSPCWSIKLGHIQVQSAAFICVQTMATLCSHFLGSFFATKSAAVWHKQQLTYHTKSSQVIALKAAASLHHKQLIYYTKSGRFLAIKVAGCLY